MSIDHAVLPVAINIAISATFAYICTITIKWLTIRKTILHKHNALKYIGSFSTGQWVQSERDEPSSLLKRLCSCH